MGLLGGFVGLERAQRSRGGLRGGLTKTIRAEFGTQGRVASGQWQPPAEGELAVALIWPGASLELS